MLPLVNFHSFFLDSFSSVCVVYFPVGFEETSWGHEDSKNEEMWNFTICGKVWGQRALSILQPRTLESILGEVWLVEIIPSELRQCVNNCHKRTSKLVAIQTPQNHKTKKKKGKQFIDGWRMRRCRERERFGRCGRCGLKLQNTT